ncbi:MAG: energy-coupling factor transporter transmembrane protein EcfT [Acidipropionibacterium sp.]|nr:energy-coupling factor transporter transmembrane protein EcfT [Acidipropionibacterium sp.]
MSVQTAPGVLTPGRSTRSTPLIDPRTVLLHILLLWIVTLTLRSMAATAMLVLVTAVFVAVAASARGAVTMVLFWFACVLMKSVIEQRASATPFTLLLPMLTIFVRIGPLMAAGLLFTGAFSVSRFISALERLRVPRTVTVTLAVMLRFVPTIGQELRHIDDALRTRGVPLTPVTFLRAPVRTAELIVVPLVQRCITVAEELSAAAITRGLERPAPRTTRIPLVFRASDGWYLVLLALSTCGVLLIDRWGMR